MNDLLDLRHGGYETCFSTGEKACMKQAEAAVKAGGAAFFLIDKNLLKHEEGNVEEDVDYRKSTHEARRAPSAFSEKIHSKDDDYPPDHWVAYLGGLDLGDWPEDTDPVSIRLWSYGKEYVVTGSVEGFAEYLWAVVAGC